MGEAPVEAAALLVEALGPERAPEALWRSRLPAGGRLHRAEPGRRAVLRCAPGEAVCTGSLSFSPDGRYLACSSRSGARLWDLEELRELPRLPGPGYQAPVFGADGCLWLAGPRGIVAWDVERALPLIELAIAVGADDLQLEADRILWRSGSQAGVAEITGKQLVRTSGVAKARLSPCGRTLAIVPQERKGDLELRDVDSGRLLVSRRADGRVLMDLAFSPDGRWLATGGWRALRTWHPRSAAPGMVASEGRLPVYRVAFGAGVLLSLDSHLRVWNPQGRSLASIPAEPCSQTPLSITPDGRLAVSGRLNPSGALIYDLECCVVLASLSPRLAPGRCLVKLSPDGRLLALGGPRGIEIHELTVSRPGEAPELLEQPGNEFLRALSLRPPSTALRRLGLSEREGLLRWRRDRDSRRIEVVIHQALARKDRHPVAGLPPEAASRGILQALATPELEPAAGRLLREVRGWAEELLRELRDGGHSTTLAGVLRRNLADLSPVQRTGLELEEGVDPGPQAPLREAWDEAHPLARERMAEGALRVGAAHLARVWWDGHPDSLRRLGSPQWTQLGRLLRTNGERERLLQVARQASALRAAELLAEAEHLPELRALARAALPELKDRRAWQLGVEAKELASGRVAVSPCGRWGAATFCRYGSHHQCLVWDLSTGTRLETIPGGRAVAFSSDGVLATAVGRTVELRQAGRWSDARRLEGLAGAIHHLEFSPRDRYLLVLADKRTRMFDLERGDELTLAGDYRRASFSSDETRLLLEAWGTEIRTLPGGTLLRQSWHRDGHLAPDGRQVGHPGTFVHLLETDTGVELGRLDSNHFLRWVAFSPAGRWLGAADLQAVQAWDLQRSRALPALELPDHRRSCGFGCRLLRVHDPTASLLWGWQGLLRWDLETGDSHWLADARYEEVVVAAQGLTVMASGGAHVDVYRLADPRPVTSAGPTRWDAGARGETRVGPIAGKFLQALGADVGVDRPPGMA